MLIERLKLGGFLFSVISVEVYIWGKFTDFILSAYAFLAITFLLSKIFGWPSASWLGGRYLKEVEEMSGEARLGHKYDAADPVRNLKGNTAAKTYFAASTYGENTRSLCRSVGESLTGRIFAYTGLTLLFMFLDANKFRVASGPPLEVEAKIAALIFALILPLGSDFVRLERQKTWNLQLNKP